VSKLIPFDSLNLYAVLTECQLLVGGRIQDIRQPDAHTVVLFVYAQRAEHRLLLSIDPQHARLHKITSKVPNAPVPPPFCQSLRKHIEGGFIKSLHMVGFDRVVEIAVQTREGIYTLIAELMGKHSNLILVDPGGLIQSALKWVSPRQSSVRPIRSGERYQLPPTRVETLKNPLLMTESDWRELWHLSDGKPDWQAHLEGLSRFTAQELDLVAQQEGIEGVIRWMERLRRAEWQPIVVRDPATHRLLGAYPLPLRQLPVDWQHPRSTVNLAWEQAFVDRISHAGQEHLRSSLLTPLRRALQSRARALKELEQALTEGQKADRWQLFGALILAYGHTVEPGSILLKAPDYTQPEMPLVEIRLDPDRTPAENAERYFQKARRARENQSLLQSRYASLQEEYHLLQSFVARAEQSTQTEELKRLYAEAQERGWLREVQSVSPARRAEQDPFEGHKIRVHLSPDGYQVLVGENAQANDYLLTRVARPNDWWLHVRTGTGAHVIIRTNNQPQRVPRSTLEFAGRLAVKHSTDRHAHTVEVDYTLRKYVRKPKGAPSGFALYTHEKTLRITQ